MKKETFRWCKSYKNFASNQRIRDGLLKGIVNRGTNAGSESVQEDGLSSSQAADFHGLPKSALKV